MSKVSVTKRKLDALAAAISLKSGEDLPLTLDAMREAVNNITFPEPGDSFDGPIFTATDQSLSTVVCDKTYSEVSNLISNNVYYTKFIIPSSVSGSEDFIYYGTYINNKDGYIIYIIYPVPYYSNGSIPSALSQVPITGAIILGMNSNQTISDFVSVQDLAVPNYDLNGHVDDYTVSIESITTECSFEDLFSSAVVLFNVSLDNGRSVNSYIIAGIMESGTDSSFTYSGYVRISRTYTTDDFVKISVTHSSNGTYFAVGEYVVHHQATKYVTHSDVIQDITADVGYTSIYKVRVNAVELQSKEISPSQSSQTVTPDSGYTGLSRVTVYPIPSRYGDTSTDTARAYNLLVGQKAHTIVNGVATQITGTMPNRGAVTATIDGLTTTSYTIPEGYHSGSGTVSLTNAIELALAAI